MDVARHLQPDEIDLVGRWLHDGSGARADEVEQRINHLTRHHLQKIAKSNSGWEVLFRDPADGRYWELSYPLGGMHGGGPKRLTNLTAELAATKYRL